MLTQLLILALSATAFARPPKAEPVGAVETITSELCPADLRHFLLPHEYDCAKFYYCEYGQKWVEPRDCALGTHFSFELQVCVHPYQAGCTLPGEPTEAPEIEAPETEATTATASSTIAAIVSSPHTTEAPETEATTAAASSTIAGIISSPHTTEAPETEATTAAASSTIAGIISSPHTTEAPETEATTAAASSTIAGIISSPHTTEAPETEATTAAASSTIAGIVSSPHTTEGPETESTTAAASSTIAGIISSPHTTEAPETEATTAAASSTIAAIISSPHTTEAPQTETSTSAPLSTEASIISSPQTTKAPETEATVAPITASPEGAAPEGTEWLENGCPADWEIHWLLSHEECNKFYYCNFGEKVERECPPNTYFNADLQVCDHAWNVECAVNENNSNEDSDDSAEDSEGQWLDNGCPSDWNIHWLLPHKDCGKFYYCVHGQKVERECPEPLHFNPTIQVCDWAESAGCVSGENSSVEDNNEENSGEDNNTAAESNEVEWLENGCPADLNVHWLLPHESDCGKFYYCVQGQKVERECREPLHFNPTLQVCDWAESAGCGLGGSSSVENGGEDNNEEENDTDTESHEEEWLENGCPADFDVHWLLPHKSDCGKFYYCVQGQKVERECREPLHFNPTLQVCDWADNAGCASGANSSEDDNNEESSGEGDNTEEDNGEWLDNGCPADLNVHWLLPHESDCGKFYHCVHGEKVERECLEPTHFNPTLQVCDWAENAGCKASENNDSNSEEDSSDNGSGETSNEDNSDNGSGETSNEDNTENGSGGDNNNESNEVEWLDNGCPADLNTHWLLPHETDCSRFYYCVQGLKVERECNEPLHFNPTLQVCDWAENAGCAANDKNSSEEENSNGSNSGEDNSNGGNSEEDNTVIAPEEEPDHSKCASNCNILPWAHQTACDKYWRCEGEEAVLVVCSEGLHFNAKTGSCDFICNANCVRNNVQTTADQQGLKIFVPWDKVSEGMRL